jgi:Prophage tail length tape measure protein
MSNLENLVFTANTDSLKAAIGVIGEVGAAMLELGKSNKKLTELSKEQTQAALNNEKVSQAQAKTRTAEAKELDALVKVKLTETKASEAAAKTKLAETKATEAATKATEENSKILKDNVSILERQKDIRDFMATGASKGEASILASSKATKAANAEIEETYKVLQQIRQLQGGNPFDKSIGGLIALKNQFRELQEVQQQYSNNSGLSVAQAKALAQDKLRLGVLFEQKNELHLLDEAVKLHTTNTIQEANAVNVLVAASKEIDRQQREVANSTRAVAKEEEKMLFAMEAISTVRGNGSRAAAQQAINEATFARNVRLSGVSAEEAAKKIKLYGEQQTALAAAEEKHKVDYVTRAVGPQLTDIFSGLATGQQSLYTIAIQQGGQLMDQFALSGIEANKMKEILANAVPNMLENIKKVAFAFGGILTGAITAVGTALKDLVTGGFAIATEGLGAVALGVDGLTLAIERVKASLMLLAKTGILVLITALVAAGYELYELFKKNQEVSIGLNTMGQSLGLTTIAAREYAESLSGSTGSTNKFLDSMIEMSKVGGFVKGDIEQVSKSAQSMQKYAGVAIKDTIEEFKKMKDDPVKALTELGIKTGDVSEATMDLVKQFIDQGDKASAAAIAMNALKEANAKAVDGIKKDMGPLETILDTLATKFRELGNSMKNSFVEATKPTTDLSNAIIKLNAAKAAKDSFASQSSFAKSVTPGGSTSVDAAYESAKKEVAVILQAVEAEKEKGKQQQKNIEMSKAREANEAADKEFSMKLINKSRDRLPQEEYINQKIEERQKLMNGIALSEENIKKARQVYALEWEKSNKEKVGKKDNFSMVISPLDEINKVKFYYEQEKNEATKAFTNQEKLIKSQASNKLITQEEAASKELALTDQFNQDQLALDKEYTEKGVQAFKEGMERIKKERQSSLDANQNPENVPKINEKAEAAFKQLSDVFEKYISTLETDANLTQDRIFTNAILAMDKYKGSIYNAALEYLKFNAVITASYAAIDQENRATDLKASLIGKTTEEQLKLTRAYEQETKLSKVQVDLEKELQAIRNNETLKANPALVETEITAAYKLAADKRKAINYEVAVTAADDFHKEMEKISKPIADSLVTALFDGGKSGAKKLRDEIVKVFRDKITIVVDATINAGLSQILGGNSNSAGNQSPNGLGALSNLANYGNKAYNYLFPSSGSSMVGSAAATSTGEAVSLAAGNSAGAAIVDAYELQGANLLTGSSAAVGSSALSSIAASAPYVLAAIAAYKMISAATSGEERSGGQYGYAFNGSVLNKNTGATMQGQGTTFLGGPSGGDPNSTATKTGINATVANINSLITGFGGTSQLTAFQGGYETSSKGRGGVGTGGTLSNGQSFGYSGQGSVYDGTLFKDIYSKSPDVKQAMADFSTDLQRSTLEALQLSDITGPVKDYLAKLGDVEKLTAEVVTEKFNEVGAYQALSVTLKAMPFDYLKTMSVEASKTLLTASGGLQNLVTGLSNFYDKFYTSDEKTANLTKATTAAFSQLGVVMPELNDKTRAWYRSEVERLGATDLSIEANSKAYYGMLSLAGAIDTLAPAVAAVRTQTEILTSVEKLKSDQGDLYIKLAEAQCYSCKSNDWIKYSRADFNESELCT